MKNKVSIETIFDMSENWPFGSVFF